MRREGLKAVQPCHFIPRTSDGKASKPSPNLLAGLPFPPAPDLAWAGDITFIPCAAGWLYLAVVIDLCSRRVIGWSLAARMQAGLVTDALKQAVQSRRPTAATLFHSDRGSQYSSGPFRELLGRSGLVQSMSGRANPYGNAWTESFIGTLTAELIRGGSIATAEDARAELFEYIDAYYNSRRLHSSLGYRSPMQCEAEFQQPI